jgi:Prokaryotic Cytochrome C oxidase subunit IV
MAALLKTRITVVWLALIAATLTSLWLGVEDPVGNATLAGALVLLVAFVKVRFVALYFMELRNAPIPLRVTFEGWCLVVCGVVVGMFLFT